MDVGPSIERKQAWIKLDDDRVEYATINHQLVPTENQPKQDLSTVTGGEPSQNYRIILF